MRPVLSRVEVSRGRAREQPGSLICQAIMLHAAAIYKKGRTIEEIKKALNEQYSRFWLDEKKWPL